MSSEQPVAQANIQLHNKNFDTLKVYFKKIFTSFTPKNIDKLKVKLKAKQGVI